MDIAEKEKRKFSRYIFGLKEGVKAVIAFPLKELELSSSVLDISEGGVRLVILKDQDHDHDLEFHQGDVLTLRKLNGISDLSYIAPIDMMIKWVLNLQDMKHIALGCEFHKIEEDKIRKIRFFINSKANQFSFIN